VTQEAQRRLDELVEQFRTEDPMTNLHRLFGGRGFLAQVDLNTGLLERFVGDPGTANAIITGLNRQFDEQLRAMDQDYQERLVQINERFEEELRQQFSRRFDEGLEEIRAEFEQRLSTGVREAEEAAARRQEELMRSLEMQYSFMLEEHAQQLADQYAQQLQLARMDADARIISLQTSLYELEGKREELRSMVQETQRSAMLSQAAASEAERRLAEALQQRAAAEATVATGVLNRLNLEIRVLRDELESSRARVYAGALTETSLREELRMRIMNVLRTGRVRRGRSGARELRSILSSSPVGGVRPRRNRRL